MSEYVPRQIDLLHRIMLEYNSGVRTLNSLVITIETVVSAIGIQRFSDEIFPLILSMEQINTVMIEENRALTELERDSVAEQLLRLEEVTIKFYQSAKSTENHYDS